MYGSHTMAVGVAGVIERVVLVLDASECESIEFFNYY